MGDTNAQHNDIAIIREALRLREDEYKVIHENSFYIIQPNRNRQSHIAPIMSADIFKYYNLEFRNCVFENLHFTNETIDKKIRFQNCIFKKCTLDRCVFEDFVNFNFGNLNGSCKGNFVCTDTIFKDIVYFIKLTFDGNVDFSRSRFKERAFFSETTFNNNADFTEVIFGNNAYFDEVGFQGEAVFSLSEFKQNAHFYGTYFNESPNFIQAIFSGNINFTNAELDFGFDVVKNEIEDTYNTRKEEYNKKQDKEDKKEPRKYKIANEFRDSFKNIKSSLIEKHNMLDASQFHRVELYCKELELEYKRKETESVTRDVVDRIHLMLYRLTSDHHTDLLLILNNVIILIALFGVANFALSQLNQFDTLQFEFLACCISLLKVSICVAFVSISIFILLHRKLTLKESYRKCLKFIKDDFVMMLLYFAFMLYALFSYPSSACLLCIAFSIPFLYFIVYMSAKRFRIKIAKKITLPLAYFMFCFMFIIRYCVVILAYIVDIITLFCSPSSILPVLGKLIDNKDSKYCCCDELDIFGFCLNISSFPSDTLNFIYMLFLFLLLWSLQKTARKNTIVPN